MVHAALVLSVKVKCLLKVPYSVCRHGDGRTKLNYWFKDSFFTLMVCLLIMLVLLVTLEPGVVTLNILAILIILMSDKFKLNSFKCLNSS